MLRKLTFCLALAGFCGVANAGVFAFDDGPTRVVMIDGTSANDECEIKFRDDEDDDAIESGRVEVELNGQEYEFEAVAGPYTRLYVIFRGWNGDDTLTAKDLALDFPEFFYIYFDGGNHDDNFDNQTDIDSTARGGYGEDILLGGGGNDDLAGGRDFDILMGGDGNDDMSDYGDGIRDEMYGGDGADHFGRIVYQRTPGSRRYTLISGNRFMDYNGSEGDSYDFEVQ
ncbi:hypothetical protein [Planctomycetes bacterium TBK1r]|uniref:Hemolysin, chromosomal n=1 Tax=Stieleria magnilauensis TaxID=2527963 RepID=A0ABX5XJ11_9BACT|nr:Hemolysin, chromosomal [Planctomycetes bacterium TBK1r]